MHKHRGEEGSAMLLALVFLLFCMFTGSAVLASAAANAGRNQQQIREQADFLHCRSGILLCRERLWNGSGPSLTIRDVTEKDGKEIHRTVTYSLRGGGDSLLLSRLVNHAITAYEQKHGIPKERRFEQFPHSFRPDTELAMPLTITSEYEGTGRTLEGVYEIENGTDAVIRLTAGEANLELTMRAVTGSGDGLAVTVDGVTRVTNTTFIQWEAPVIGKGDSHEKSE